MTAPPQGVKVGDRIRLTNMPNDPCPIEAGAEGTVERVTRVDGAYRIVTEVQIGLGWWSISVDWDNDRSLCLSVPPDQFEIVR